MRKLFLARQNAEARAPECGPIPCSVRGARDSVVADSMDVTRAAHTAISWAGAEGWNPGLDDAERFLAADPNSFLTVEREGEIDATVSCALYGDSYAFVGFFIVRSGLRGRGIGAPLFQRALERAGERVVGLDGVLEQQGYYERRGFVLAHGN